MPSETSRSQKDESCVSTYMSTALELINVEIERWLLGAGGREMGTCLMHMKFWKLAVQQCAHLKMVKMVNFMLYIFTTVLEKQAHWSPYPSQTNLFLLRLIFSC